MANEKQTETAVVKPDHGLVTSIAIRIKAYVDKGELVLPADYSSANALKSAWLVLQETVDREKRPVLQTCSQASIANALLDMIIQGLNPIKAQCYFIAYGTKLVCFRSYFGTMTVAQRVAGAKDIWAEVVYRDDEFEYSMGHGRKTITKHTQKLENIKLGDIVAAYCVIEFGNDKPSYTEIMTMEQIHVAWAKSKMNPDAPSSTHSLYPEEMAKRTVINRACKKLINSSSDSNLFLQSFHRADDETAEAEIKDEIKENANKEVLDVEPGTGEIVTLTAEEAEELAWEKARFAEESKDIPKPKAETKSKRDSASLKTIAEMMKACFDDFSLQPKQVVKELGYNNQSEIAELPKDCYERIGAIYGDMATAKEEAPGF